MTKAQRCAWCIGVSLSCVSAWLVSSARSRAHAGPAPALVAVYETRIDAAPRGSRTTRWSFSRRGREVEYHFFEREISERWSEDERANASYARIFHRERGVVRYSAGDLRAHGVTADWSRLRHVIEPPDEASFARRAGSTVMGWPTDRYTAQRTKERVEVLWIDALAIPAEVRVSAAGRPRVQVRLRELRAEEPAPRDLRGYRQIDVADFGDMEHDPFVKRHHHDPLPNSAPALSLHREPKQPTAAHAARAHAH